jgi:hypothetical protein
MKQNCTRSKSGRTLKRHIRQDDIDIMLTQAISVESKRDIKTRQHLMERSFARSTRYGYKRSRWRRLWRVQIQEYLTASIQNIMVLLGNIKEPTAAQGMIKAQKAGIRAGETQPLCLSRHIKTCWGNTAEFYRADARTEIIIFGVYRARGCLDSLIYQELQHFMGGCIVTFDVIHMLRYVCDI